MKKISVLTIIFILYSLTSCEAFFTTSWFSAAADYSDVSVEEAISSGDPAVMKELYDRLVDEAASATGEQAADLYLDAADLALGLSGLSDPSILFEAPELLSGGDGGVGDIFAILTETDLDLDALENVSVMIANAEGADPGSVPADMWLFAAAGSGAAVVSAAEDAGYDDVGDYLDTLGSDPVTDSPDVKQAVQSLVYAMDVLPDDMKDQLLDNQTDLESKGVVFP